jgi:cyanophycinase
MADPGALIVIGGHEDKTGERAILKEVAARVHGGRLVIATLASHEPEGYFEGYQKAFADLGVTDLVELYVQNRAEARSPEKLALLDGAAGVFFSGGDQLRLASQIGDTPLERRVRQMHRSGAVLAGTSAGASAMGGIMMVRGASRETHRIGDLQMAAGLALLPGLIIDQHFAERGRIGRLLGAVAHNPRLLGVGVDENTAMVVEGSGFRVVGAGGVYVADAGEVSWVNVAEAVRQEALAIHDVKLHVLSAGDRFDFDARRPTPGSPTQ